MIFIVKENKNHLFSPIRLLNISFLMFVFPTPLLNLLYSSVNLQRPDVCTHKSQGNNVSSHIHRYLQKRNILDIILFHNVCNYFPSFILHGSHRKGDACINYIFILILKIKVGHIEEAALLHTQAVTSPLGRKSTQLIIVKYTMQHVKVMRPVMQHGNCQRDSGESYLSFVGLHHRTQNN